jgi:hypothetical protein
MVAPYNYELLFSDNFATTLTSGVTNSQTTLPLGSVTGLPAIGSSTQAFLLSLTDAATQTNQEVVLVTNITGLVATVVRGQEGTTAQNWLAGDIVENRWTAGSAASMQQTVEAQAQSANYAADTGSVNAVTVALTPALVAHVVGMPIRVSIGNTNTDAVTFNPGPSAVAVTGPNGSALIAGDIVVGDIVEFIYNGTSYNVQVVQATTARPGIAQIATNAQVAIGTDPSKIVTPAGLASLGFAAAIAALGVTMTGDEYLKIPLVGGGYFILQWGQSDYNISGGPSFVVGAIDFPISFPNACFGCIAIPQKNVGGNPAVAGNNFTAITYTYNPGACAVRIDTDDGGSPNITVPVTWLAWGF